MKVIGLTGGIGSGKSTVSQFLAELGAIIIDADKLGHEAFKPGTDAWREIVATFGEGVLAHDGSIDRYKLGKAAFISREKLNRLNQIMHPRMFEVVKARLEEYRKQGVNVVVLEATLLIEAGWTPLVDEVWVTVAPRALVLKRLKENRNMSDEEALSRINSQLSSSERTRHADVVIDTDCSLDELRAKISELWQKRLYY